MIGAKLSNLGHPMVRFILYLMMLAVSGDFGAIGHGNMESKKSSVRPKFSTGWFNWFFLSLGARFTDQYA